MLGIAANSVHDWATVKTLAEGSTGVEDHFTYGLYRKCGGSSLDHQWGDCCSKSKWGRRHDNGAASVNGADSVPSACPLFSPGVSLLYSKCLPH